LYQGRQRPACAQARGGSPLGGGPGGDGESRERREGGGLIQMQAFAPRTAAAVGVAGSGSLEGSPPTPLLFLGLPAVELFSAPACG